MSPESITRAASLDAHVDRLVLGRNAGEASAETPRLVHRILACVGDVGAANVLSWTRELGRLFGADVTIVHVSPTSVLLVRDESTVR